VPQGTYAIGSTISLTADGQCLYGDGNLSVIKTTATTARIDINNKDGTAIRNLKIDAFAANTNPGIYVYGGSSGIDIENVYFYGGNQRVYLGACDHIRVDSCTFDNTGYGVIQQSGYASSFGIVTNCIARDVKTDFVELNCNLNDSGYLIHRRQEIGLSQTTSSLVQKITLHLALKIALSGLPRLKTSQLLETL
jgi:hypothetical protein